MASGKSDDELIRMLQGWDLTHACFEIDYSDPFKAIQARRESRRIGLEIVRRYPEAKVYGLQYINPTAPEHNRIMLYTDVEITEEECYEIEKASKTRST